MMPAFVFSALAALLWFLAFFPFMEELARLFGIGSGCSYAIAIYWSCAALLLIGGLIATVVLILKRRQWNRWYAIALVGGIPGLLFYVLVFFAHLAH